MIKFEVGKMYHAIAIGDHEVVYKFKVVKRTAKTVWLVEDCNLEAYETGDESKAKARRVSPSPFGDVETCNPCGRYSMSPTLSADREFTPVESSIEPPPEPRDIDKESLEAGRHAVSILLDVLNDMDNTSAWEHEKAFMAHPLDENALLDLAEVFRELINDIEEQEEAARVAADRARLEQEIKQADEELKRAEAERARLEQEIERVATECVRLEQEAQRADEELKRVEAERARLGQEIEQLADDDYHEDSPDEQDQESGQLADDDERLLPEIAPKVVDAVKPRMREAMRNRRTRYEVALNIKGEEPVIIGYTARKTRDVLISFAHECKEAILAVASDTEWGYRHNDGLYFEDEASIIFTGRTERDAAIEMYRDADGVQVSTTPDIDLLEAASSIEAEIKAEKGEFDACMRPNSGTVGDLNEQRKGYIIDGIFGISNESGYWVVTHIPSGYRLPAFYTQLGLRRRKEAYRHVALLKASGIDWSRPRVDDFDREEMDSFKAKFLSNHLACERYVTQ